jgi:hypothetical protein
MIETTLPTNLFDQFSSLDEEGNSTKIIDSILIFSF